MPTLADSRVAPPKGWDEFEDIVCSAAKNRWRNSDFTRHGRQGQEQHGVDVYGKDDKGQVVGLQCKNTCSGVTERTIEDEVENAEAFEPALRMLYIATTALTDKKIQAFVRTRSENRQAAGLFGIEILFWNDVWHDLTLDEARVYQHFPHLKPHAVTEREQPHDQRLFQEFQSVFSFVPAIQLLRDHDFGGSYPRKAIQPLFDFVEAWNQPDREFLDKGLQAALADLYRAARVMSNHLCDKTVPIGNGDYASVFSDQQRATGPRPEHVIEEARILNQQASLFVPIYEHFFRLCRSTLSR
ncbi:hypothetical protein SCD_n00256 [Sulfuricella denitrificans skB26]|uniref:Restriction endonuclease type IV Mrr domain-containing protein n=1 Tax=Sulfuricella denitrificans (strain DSM 22764 / NBRC 105220 / skB26) TaxID=1163617 RepID=S6A9H2_SULDS|nr:hypothetical protein [Sulfuricella denitrificans]BAN34105.1 hypothetical protein SCD_n00256 [Sulfuricella denitrificans skB26]